MGYQGAEGSESVESIKGWVEALDIEGEGEGQQKPRCVRPLTPPQKRIHVQRYEAGAPLCEEVSPTVTNSSSDTVFDSPISAFNLGGTRDPGRGRYAETEASSVDDEDDDETYARKELFASVEESEARDAEPALHPANTSSEDSTTLLDHSTASNEQNTVPKSALYFDPNVSHLIWITSCLQCVLADLQCSRTLPACSRCVRKGHGSLCLLQRKRLHAEIYDENHQVDTTPVLLRKEGDDDEVWARKVELANNLLSSWLLAQDQINWVLPINNGVHGDWKTTLRSSVKHPGEGRGRLTFVSVRLAGIHPNAFRNGNRKATGE